MRSARPASPVLCLALLVACGREAKPPADLTQLARKAGGQLDERALLEVIDGRRQVSAHGTRDMPVWGARPTRPISPC
jgi:hypothetical protein